MHKLLFLFCLCLSANTMAQSIAGLTGIPDTSYTNRSAWLSTQKTNPETLPVTTRKHVFVSVQKDIVYHTAGKKVLELDAFRPKEKKSGNAVAVIIIHGGGWRSGNRSQHHQLAEHLASLGYTCFTPAYRLSTDALFPAAVYDLKAAIRWVKQHAKEYETDSSRLAVLGFSAGGELAAFLGVTGNMPLFEGTDTTGGIGTNVQAVVDIDGILSFVHPESGEGDDSKQTSAATFWFGYPKRGNEKLWEAASSLSYAGPYTPPTLFLNSRVARMHAGREAYIAILGTYHTYTEVHTFATAPHSFCLFEPWFTPTVQYIDAFLKKVFAR